MLKIFKPNWIIIEVIHERYTFDTYYTYCHHMTLEEVEEQFMLDKKIKEKDKNGAYIYDDCGVYGEKYQLSNSYFERYNIEYTIIIPTKNKKLDQYFICGSTSEKFGLYDKKYYENK